LGWIESVVILGSIEVLFALFIVIQIRYLFGAQANISAAGFTYADYARRGFFELVAVAVISLLVYVILSAVTKRDQLSQRNIFSILVTILMVLVLVILGSSYQRLTLYESAYGFAYLRTYTHFFIPWLAVLLVAVMVWELLHKQRFFMLSLIVCIFGFGITLAVVNLDGFMAEKNIQRALQGEELDTHFLAQLSNDAIPVLIREYSLANQQMDIKDTLGANLSCRLAETNAAGKTSWKSFHLGAWMVERSLINFEKDLKQYPTKEGNRGGWVVKVKGIEQDCWSSINWD
jgi:hypothetical protein